MAKKISIIDMKKPGLLGVRRPRRPFTDEEIRDLTAGVETFALTDEGDYLFL